MSAASESAERRRGRRPSGEDTRAALLEAARTEFTERGYQGARVRSIATAAGVDAAMVNHWFGGKEGLFAAALELPVNPDALLTRLMDGDPEGTGERIVRTFLSVWDANDGGPFVGLLRSVATHDTAARMVREFVSEVIFGRLVSSLSSEDAELRASLCGSQMVGLGMARYVIRLEPLASADVDTVAATIGPTLQRYLTGSIS